ncbi:hypothetical protein E1218_34670 [Kribbella turkmenica]|uniref:Uncharacterized protein n=1 Tax=Kribbella turkmenica TaxID=2530375 RepID=A0A4R4W455_9ACTN|nr:hypothetical protein [Kribbella turkmenica]TDD13338.1 hypothetical protein E1218_34670 [Kribbella turkmenica]
MNDHELDRLIAQADPFGADQVRRLPASGAGAELLEEILTTTEPTPTARRRRPILIAGVAAAAVAAVTIGGVLIPEDHPAASVVPGAPAPAYAAEVRAIAEANSRILLGDGWKIVRVSDFSKKYGEMTFGKGKQEVSIAWYPANEHASLLADRARGGNKVRQVEALGRKATRIQYLGPENKPGGTGMNGKQVPTYANPTAPAGKNLVEKPGKLVPSTDFATILPPGGAGGAGVAEIRADLGSERAYMDMLGKARTVDVTTWLDAMPPTVVRPEARRQVIDEILAGLPLPAGLDKQKLYQGGVADRYQVGAKVTGAVACGWIGQWAQAKKNGDAAKKAEAAKALAGSRSWKILIEMNSQGDFPETIWEFADSITKHDVIDREGKPGRQDEYKEGLGCD